MKASWSWRRPQKFTCTHSSWTWAHSRIIWRAWWNIDTEPHSQNFCFRGCGVHLRTVFLIGDVDTVGLKTIDLVHFLHFTGATVWWMWAIDMLFYDISVDSNRSWTIAFKVTFPIVIIFFFFLLVLVKVGNSSSSSVVLLGSLEVGRRF